MLILQASYAKTASPASIYLDRDDRRELAVFYRSLRLKYDDTDLHLSFSAESSSVKAKLFGFWQPEPAGTWSAGSRSALLFDNALPKGRKIQLTLEASCFREAYSQVDVELCTSSGHRAVARISGNKKVEITLRKPFFLRSARLVTGDFQAVDQTKNVSTRKETPLVSIIILNQELPLLTRASAIAAASSLPDCYYEIVCVDNGSCFENLTHLYRSEVQMRIIELKHNHGFGDANNIAAKVARGDFLLFLNNDAFLCPGAISEMLHTFEMHPNCGAAGAVLRYPDGAVQEAGCSINEDGTAVRHGRSSKNFNPNTLPRFVPVDYVSGACLMIRSRDFLSWGGFDPVYSPAYYEDADLCFRVRQKGKVVYLAKQAQCYHVENATSIGLNSPSWATLQSEKNRITFLRRWKHRIRPGNCI